MARTLVIAVALVALSGGNMETLALSAAPVITPAPILPRQNNADFMGYFSTRGEWVSLDCNPGLTWYQSGDYAQCCPTTLPSCIAPTACAQGIQFYPGTSIACTLNYDNPRWSVCQTVFIYENTADSSPQTDIVCGESSVNWSYYRQIPSSTTSSSTTEESTSETESSPTSTSSSTSTPVPAKKKKSSSKAWIAGAVAGPLVGLALIFVAVFVILRRRKKQVPNPNANPALLPPPAPPTAPQYTDTKPPFANYLYQQQQSQPMQTDPYNSPPLSPAPQYTAPYQTAASPPPQTYNGPPVPHNSGHTPQPAAAELGAAGPMFTGQHKAAELAVEPGRR